MLTLGTERAALMMRGLVPREARDVSDDERFRLHIFQTIGACLGSVEPLRASISKTRALRRVLDVGDPDLLSIGYALEVLLLGLDGSRNRLEVRRLVAKMRELARPSSRVRAWADLADGGGYYFWAASINRRACSPKPSSASAKKCASTAPA